MRMVCPRFWLEQLEDQEPMRKMAKMAPTELTAAMEALERAVAMAKRVLPDKRVVPVVWAPMEPTVPRVPMAPSVARVS